MKIGLFLFILLFNYTTSSAYEVKNIFRYNIETELSDSSKAIGLYKEGLQFNKKKDLERAYQCFDKAIELDSNFAEAYVGRAVLKYITQRYHGIWDDYSMAIKLKPDFGEAYFERGCFKAFISGKGIFTNNDGESDFKKAKELGFIEGSRYR